MTSHYYTSAWWEWIRIIGCCSPELHCKIISENFGVFWIISNWKRFLFSILPFIKIHLPLSCPIQLLFSSYSLSFFLPSVSFIFFFFRLAIGKVLKKIMAKRVINCPDMSSFTLYSNLSSSGSLCNSLSTFKFWTFNIVNVFSFIVIFNIFFQEIKEGRREVSATKSMLFLFHNIFFISNFIHVIVSFVITVITVTMALLSLL